MRGISDLPVEILEKIVQDVEKADLYTLSLVSNALRDVVHSLARLVVRNLVEKKIVETKYLARIGWIEGQHFPEQCSCIDIAYRQKPFGPAFQGTELSDEDESPLVGWMDACALSGDGIYYTDSDKKGSLMTLARNRPVYSNTVDSVIDIPDWNTVFQLYLKGFTLVSLSVVGRSSSESLSNWAVRVYDTQSSRFCYTLNYNENLPEGFEQEGKSVFDVAITSSQIAIHICDGFYGHENSEKHTLIYKIDADRPEIKAEYLLTVPSKTCIALEDGATGETWHLTTIEKFCFNDAYMVLEYKQCPDFFVDAAGEINFRGGMRAIAVYKKESLHLEPGYVVHTQDGLLSRSAIEEGDSPFLVCYNESKPITITLFNLELKQILAKVKLTRGLNIPCNWFGGVFTLLQVVDNEIRLQILDPRNLPAPADATGSADSRILSPGRKVPSTFAVNEYVNRSNYVRFGQLPCLGHVDYNGVALLRAEEGDLPYLFSFDYMVHW